MTDELEVIAGLSPDQVTERAKSLQLEVAYWQQVLTDCEAVNVAVRDGAVAIIESTSAALVLVPVVDAAALVLVESIVAGNRKALDALNAVSDVLGGTLELADGRTKSLRPVSDALLRAAGVDPHSTDER